MLATKDVVRGWLNGLYTAEEAMDFIADQKVAPVITKPAMDWLNGKLTAEGALRDIAARMAIPG